METIDPTFQGLSESYREQVKACERFKNRGKRQRFFIGFGSVLIGFTIGAMSVIVFQSLYAIVIGYAIGVLGFILIATSVVPRVRQWHYSGSVAFGIVEAGPPDREIDQATRKAQLRDAAAWAEQATRESNPDIKIRCLGCEQLNEDDARFCKSCGKGLRS